MPAPTSPTGPRTAAPRHGSDVTGTARGGAAPQAAVDALERLRGRLLETQDVLDDFLAVLGDTARATPGTH